MCCNRTFGTLSNPFKVGKFRLVVFGETVTLMASLELRYESIADLSRFPEVLSKNGHVDECFRIVGVLVESFL